MQVSEDLLSRVDDLRSIGHEYLLTSHYCKKCFILIDLTALFNTIFSLKMPGKLHKILFHILILSRCYVNAQKFSNPEENLWLF